MDNLRVILTGAFVSSVLYGLSLAVSQRTFFTLAKWPKKNSLTRATELSTFVLVTAIQSAVAAASWVLIVLLTFDIYVNGESVYNGSPSIKLLLLGLLYTTQGLLSISFMIIRMYALWNNNIWICILPIFLVVVAGGATVIASLQWANYGSILANIKAVDRRLITLIAYGAWTAVLLVILLTTAFKMLKDYRYGQPEQRTNQILCRIVTHGALGYFVISVVSLVTLAVGSDLHLLFTAFTPSIISICLGFIVTRTIEDPIRSISAPSSERTSTSTLPPPVYTADEGHESLKSPLDIEFGSAEEDFKFLERRISQMQAQ